MKQDLVIFDNQVNKFGLKNLTIVERDLWWAIASKIKDRNGDAIIISRKEIEELSGYNKLNQSTEEFERDMKSMARKIMSLNTEIIDDNGDCVLFALFPTFKISKDKEKVGIKVSEYFQSWFNNLTREFTAFELHKIVNLESKYTKELFRFLSQYRKTGYWTTSLDDFKKLMCIPEKYRWNDIETRILKPAMKELVPDIFADLKITPTKQGRKVIGLEFKFMNVIKQNKNTSTQKGYGYKAKSSDSHHELLKQKIASGEIDW